MKDPNACHPFHTPGEVRYYKSEHLGGTIAVGKIIRSRMDKQPVYAPLRSGRRMTRAHPLNMPIRSSATAGRRLQVTALTLMVSKALMVLCRFGAVASVEQR